MKIKANFMGFKQQFRDQQLIDDTLANIIDFKYKYPNSPYMPLVDTMNARLLWQKASMDKEIAALYERRDKPKKQQNFIWIRQKFLGRSKRNKTSRSTILQSNF